jgi:hypothetical protein
MTIHKKIKLSMKLQIPLTPNFIRSDEGEAYPVACFDIVILRAIGKQWTQNLIKKAMGPKK